MQQRQGQWPQEDQAGCLSWPYSCGPIRGSSYQIFNQWRWLTKAACGLSFLTDELFLREIFNKKSYNERIELVEKMKFKQISHNFSQQVQDIC